MRPPHGHRVWPAGVAAAAGSADLAAIESEIKKLDGEIDDRVYELYGLTSEERDIVEGRAK